jgi:hypothetical protein
MATRSAAPRKASNRFPQKVLDLLAGTKIVGLRSGTVHRFTGVWVVVVRKRVFARSWNDKPAGWRRAFAAEPRGALQVLDRQLRVRARAVRGESVLAAVDRAYREKYTSPGDLKWVRGFHAERRRGTTTEIVPR